MILARAAVRILKPLWSSAAARFSSLTQHQHIPCGTTITGGDHRRRGIKKPSYSKLKEEDDDDFDKKNYGQDVLDIFLGYWQELVDENCRRLLKEEGIPEFAIDAIKDDQRWMYFKRNGPIWTYGEGTVTSDIRKFWRFSLGQYYKGATVSGRPAKGIVFPLKRYHMYEQVETLTPPTIVLHKHRIAKPLDKTMLVKYEKGDYSMFKCFKKMPLPEWSKQYML